MEEFVLLRRDYPSSIENLQNFSQVQFVPLLINSVEPNIFFEPYYAKNIQSPCFVPTPPSLSTHPILEQISPL